MAEKTVELEGSSFTNNHAEKGAVPADESISVLIKLRRKSEDGLPTLDEFPAGKRSFMSRRALEERHGATPADASAVQKWAEGQGLSVTSSNLGRREMFLKGSAKAVSDAFGVSLLRYSHKRTGTEFRAHEGNLKVPASLAPIIQGVFGISNIPVAVRGRGQSRQEVVEAAEAGDWKQMFPGSFYPNEVARLYNFPGTQGNGQKVAVLEFGGGFDPKVLASYFTDAAGLGAAPTVNSVSVLGTPNKLDKSYTGEVYLDIEVIGTMAPKATIDVYFAPWTGEGYLTAIEQSIHNDDYAAISISYGLDEDVRGTTGNPGWSMLRTNVDEAFRDAVAVGVPVFVSTGDQGSSSVRGGVNGQEVTVYAPEPHASYPSSSPYAIAVGGTQLYSSRNGSIDREVVWNELGPLQDNQFYWGGATGGGVSDRYKVPSYQSSAGITPKSTSGKSGRAIPDVSGNAGSTTGYLVSQPPGSTLSIAPVGGTSASAPMWAALMACIRESLQTSFGGSVPPFFLNDFIYANGKSTAFRDIVGGREFNLDQQGRLVAGAFTQVGDNRSTAANGYSAQAGYDLCTGWGSPNGAEVQKLLTKWLQSRPNT
jgi:kumamolisin